MYPTLTTASKLLFRGKDFRTDFGCLGQVRSVIKNMINVMALTATASNVTRQVIIDSLLMKNCHIIYKELVYICCH